MAGGESNTSLDAIYLPSGSMNAQRTALVMMSLSNDGWMGSQREDRSRRMQKDLRLIEIGDRLNRIAT